MRTIIRTIAEAMAALAATALLVVWLTDAALSRVSLGGLTLNVLLRGIEPFRAMTTLEALGTGMERSLALLAVALAGATLVGITLGVTFSLSVFGPLRAIAWTAGTAGVALPSFFWAMLLQLAAVTLFVAGDVRPLPVQGFGLDAHLVLPAIALGAHPTAYVFRTTATAFEDVRHRDYVRTARGKGLYERFVLTWHILPNALPAMLAGFGMAARGALSSLAIIEYVFGWNGAGFGFIQAVAARNIPLATAIALAFALLFALIGMVVAVARRAADPQGDR